LLVPLPLVAWAFWPALCDMAHSWSTNPQDSHGYLVPGFAAYLLWLRRGKLGTEPLRPCLWAGLPLLTSALVLRLAAGFYHYVWVDVITLLPCLAGVCLMVGGWRALGWALPAIAFLFFMVPLPFRVATALSGPLQRLATICATFLMQTMGLPALAEGNVILLNKAEIGIVEACSGLRMLVVFFALATALALVIRRPLLDRLILVASAVPIALLANLARITVTGVLHETVSGEAANAFFHDAAGWFMMPLALAMLWVELWVLSRLFIEAPRAPVRRMSRVPVSPRAPSGRKRRPVAKTRRPPAPAEQPPVPVNPAGEA
jgi:exosortase